MLDRRRARIHWRKGVVDEVGEGDQVEQPLAVEDVFWRVLAQDTWFGLVVEDEGSQLRRQCRKMLYGMSGASGLL